MHTMLDWLGTLPLVALYAVACVAAAVENVFPPLPSDVIVAFAGFAAARGRGSALTAFAAVLAGNVAGAMLMYGVGARYGSGAALRRVGAAGAQEARLRDWYARYGLAAIAVSRFLPGVRAVVPPVAGALGVGALRSCLAMAVPSGIWYGGITYLAYTAGSDFDVLLARVAAGQRWFAAGAGVLVVVGVVVWWVRARHERTGG